MGDSRVRIAGEADVTGDNREAKLSPRQMQIVELRFTYRAVSRVLNLTGNEKAPA